MTWSLKAYLCPEIYQLMVWHLRHGSNPALKWLVDVIGGVADNIRAADDAVF